VAGDGAAALREIQDREPDAVVLDVTMPVMDGLAVCRALRGAGSGVPVLMLTARADIGDRVAGLDAGADDYLVKPFASAELLARLRALLRRASPPSAEDAPALRYADLVLDPAGRQVWRGQREVRLTRTEFAILEVFLRRPRQVLTRPVLVDQVWGPDLGSTSNSVDVYVGYLRRKLESGGEPRLLQTVRGTGYALRRETPRGEGS
jgi:two-component system response regulator MprA